MTKTEITKKIAQATGHEKDVVDTIVESFIKNLKESAIKGEDTAVRGLGTFKVVKRAAKTAQDMQKGVTIYLPEKFTLKLKPSKELVEKMNVSPDTIGKHITEPDQD
jgi:DNA-binding protein HU-beta